MHRRKLSGTQLIVLVMCCLGLVRATAQTLNIGGGTHAYAALTNTTVTMTGRCELWLTAATDPIPGSTIHLNSRDAWFFLPNARPSVVVASYLGQVRVNGVPAVADSNVRVVQYAMGAVVIPHASNLAPLQIFEGPHFTGAAMQLNQYTLYLGANLGLLDQAISSFKLMRGYMATMAQNENGTGVSKCYVAQDNDLEVSLLPSSLDNRFSFVRVLPWRWTGKKGIAGDIASGLNVRWYYNWNLNANSSRDLEYVPIRQTQSWPGLDQNWQTRQANHLLGYNEPDRPDQANMSVADAINSWPDLLSTGLRVGAPAVSDGGLSWLYSFMAQADAANLRVDFVPVHYYRCYNPADPSGAATQLYNFLKGIYDQVQRPLWVTEWNNGANWTGCGDPSFAQQQAAIAAMIDMLDSTPFVERYALYNWVEDVRRLKWDDGSLTAAGVTYRDKLSPVSHVQEIPNAGTRSLVQLLFENNTLDTSGYGNNAIAVKYPAFDVGRNGQAIVFDGTNNFLQLPANVANSAAFSFAAWVYWDGGANWQRIFDFGDDTNHYLFLTARATSGTLRFAMRNGGSEQFIETSALPIGQWRHVAVTLSGSTARLYTNGVQAAISTTFTISPSQFNPSRNYLGESQFSADPLFRGRLDDVQITDFAFSPSQIAALLTNAPPQFSSRMFSRPAGTNGVPYSGSISGEAIDSDSGQTLSYSKAAGPSWLVVAPNGTLFGTPGPGDGGVNFFTVRATDSAGASAFAVLTISLPIVASDGRWTSDASGNWGDSNHWSRGLIARGVGFTADFSTVDLSANRAVTLDFARTIGALKFGDSSGTRVWTLDSLGGSALTLDNGPNQPVIDVADTVIVSCPLTGTNGFSKYGAGTLILSASNSLTGTVEVDTGSAAANDGIVRAAHPAAMARVTTIEIHNNNDGVSTLQLDGTLGGVTIPARVDVSCRSLDAATIQNIAGTNTLSGFIALNAGGSLFNIQSDAGQLVFAGTNHYVGSLTGSRSYTFSGAGHHLVLGPILNSTNGAPINLIKSGSGMLTLAASNTYAGSTTVTGGVVLVNGSIRNGAVTVAGATLGGNGTIFGPVTVQSSGILAPGPRQGAAAESGIGVLTVRNNVVLQPASVTRIEISKASLTNDVLRVAGSLTYGGTLFVTRVGGTLVPGDTFKLFEAASYNGAFTSLVLPPLNVGLAWNTTALTNGRLSVVATNLPVITGYQFAGGEVQLAGSGAASQACELLSTTNLAPPVVWTPMATATADTSGVFQFTDSVGTQSLQRFYRIQVQP